MLTVKSKWLNVVTIFVLFLTTFQGLIPALPITNINTVTTISAIVMFTVTALTALKQWLSVEIQNAALWSSLIVFVLAVLGAANEMFNVVHLKPLVEQWIRFGITFVSAFLNLISKTMYPADPVNIKN